MKGFRAAITLTAVLGSLAVAAVGAAPAGAATKNQDWQVGLSFNCNNALQCGLPLGGFWGWYAFYSDGTGQATLTGCSDGGGQNGAEHINADITSWDDSGGTFVIDGASVGAILGDTHVPAAPGHYLIKMGPGAIISATVSQNPTTSGP